MNQVTSFESEERYSILEISGKNFAVEINNMKQVIPLPIITPVPNVHESIYGVFNLRGQIHTILDIRILLKLEKKPVSDKNFIVLLEWQDIVFGVVVDKVRDMRVLERDKVQGMTREYSAQFTQYLTGLYEHADLGVLYILDLEAIVETKEIKRYRYL